MRRVEDLLKLRKEEMHSIDSLIINPLTLHKLAPLVL